MARQSRKAHAPSPSVSLIIPVYNEAGHLEEFLEQIDALLLPWPKELIFVDDCSTDGSRETLENFAFSSEHKILLQEGNQGKGAALRRGIAMATGSIIAIQDADFEYNIKELSGLIRPIAENEADVVYGSRFRKNGAQVHRTFHYLINRFLTLASNSLSGLYLSDMETCYKVFRAEVIKNIHLRSNRFGFEPEITAKLSRLKLRILELPISYFPRNYLEGKKISWKDGVAAVGHILRYNLSSSEKENFSENLPDKYRLKGSGRLL